jgi:hypothetical protein
MRLMVLAALVVLCGCVSGKVYRRDVGDLKAKVSVLKAQVRERDDSIKVYEGIYRETRQVYEGVKSRAKRGIDK